jgi:adenylate kinase
MTREQDAIALNQARDAQRNSEANSQKVIEDIARLARAMSVAMARLGVSLGPMMLETLIEEVGHLPSVVRELELTTAQ